LAQKLKRLKIQHNRLKQELEIEKEQKHKILEWNCLEQIKKDADLSNPRAILLLDQIKNYNKKKPKWSETTIRQCIAWRFCSPKGYEFPRNSLLKLPGSTTLGKYFGTGNDNLIKDRLLSEIKNLKFPEMICSLIVDDMSIKESICYSKAEDRIYGLENITSDSQGKIGVKPVPANQLLCFVLQGLSTKYIIPASYYFHRHINSKTLYELTLKVLKLLTDCGYNVIRIVGDNHKNHVALFKHFGNGTLQNFIRHPYNIGLKLFFSFDYCLAVKNARNLFLDHDMASSEGMISASYLKELLTIQENLIVKPVRHLTKKHLYPSNLEKMKVHLAVQIFSPAVTASLRYLMDYGGEQFSHFKQCMPTIKYMEYIFKFFQIHDVSNRTQHIHQRDINTAPYTNIKDPRLFWLKEEFPNYIKDIQDTSAALEIRGLTKETAEALTFTAKSTNMCIHYLISELNFFYVLTRNFSSDAVESIFSNVRLRGGSNDLTDSKAAEYALRQILRSGLIKSVKSTNAMSASEYASSKILSRFQNSRNNANISVTLENSSLGKLEKLSSFTFLPNSNLQIETAATAFLCGYLIMKITEAVNGCDDCLLHL
jgi:hypothetical protein